MILRQPYEQGLVSEALHLIKPNIIRNAEAQLSVLRQTLDWRESNIRDLELKLSVAQDRIARLEEQIDEHKCVAFSDPEPVHVPTVREIAPF